MSPIISDLGLEGQIIKEKQKDNTTLDFRIEECVGHGVCGEVYKAVAKTPDGQLVYAFKFPREPRFFDHIRRAAKVMKDIGPHQNVVAFKGYGEAKQLRMPYLKMEFLDGLDFGGYVVERKKGEGGVEPDKAMNIMFQIMEAMQHFHERGIVHTDLTPSNIRIVKNGEKTEIVKIMDFEFVRIVRELSGDEFLKEEYIPRQKYYIRAGSAGGNGPALFTQMSEFVAPEARNGGKIDARADVYSIAKLLHLILIGNSIEVYGPDHTQKILHDTGYDFLYNVIMKGNKSWDGRYKSVTEMRQAISTELVNKSLGSFSKEALELRNLIQLPTRKYSNFEFLSDQGVREVGAKHRQFVNTIEAKLQESVPEVRKQLLESKRQIESLAKNSVETNLGLLMNHYLKDELGGQTDKIKAITTAWQHYPVPEILDYVKKYKVEVKGGLPHNGKTYYYVTLG